MALDDGFDVRDFRDLSETAISLGSVDLREFLPISFTKRLVDPTAAVGREATVAKIRL